MKDIDIPLRDLNVVIGPNGAGKTAFLDSFILLRESTKGALSEAISDRGGMKDILCKSNCDKLGIGIYMPQIKKFSLKYDINIKIKTIGYEIAGESFTLINAKEIKVKRYFSNDGFAIHDNLPFIDDNLEHILPKLNPQESLFSQAPQTHPELNNFRVPLSSSILFYPIDVSKRAPCRLPQELRPTKLPGSNGEFLFSVLYNLQNENAPYYDLIIDTLRAAFPGFDHLTFPLVATGHTIIAWNDKNFNAPFYPHQLSEGTLRFLWLATILLSPDLPPITLIDEPEVSLHPDLIHHLALLFQDASLRTQLIVATHSDRLIRWLKPENVLVADKNEGVATLTWADKMDLDKWLDEYTLDQLWHMGEMGGRS